ncbi:hypothetical protein GCM10027572_12030 [Flexivirga lutea]
MVAAGATLASVLYLLWLIRTRRATAQTLTGAGVFYVLFAAGLATAL